MGGGLAELTKYEDATTSVRRTRPSSVKKESRNQLTFVLTRKNVVNASHSFSWLAQGAEIRKSAGWSKRTYKTDKSRRHEAGGHSGGKKLSQGMQRTIYSGRSSKKKGNS